MCGLSTKIWREGGEEPKEKVQKGTIYADQTIGIFNRRSAHYLVWFRFLNLHNLCITVVLSRASRSGSNKSQPQGVCFLLKCLRPNGDGEIKWCLPPFGRNKKTDPHFLAEKRKRLRKKWVTMNFFFDSNEWSRTTRSKVNCYGRGRRLARTIPMSRG
jgi:hypothetical protein